MKKRCTPQLVRKTHRKTRSWRLAAQELNSLYGVNLPHLTWRDYAMSRRDIADPHVRVALLLGVRKCSACGSYPGAHFSHLLRRLQLRDLKRWQRLRNQKRYKSAREFLDEVYSRKVGRKGVAPGEKTTRYKN